MERYWPFIALAVSLFIIVGFLYWYNIAYPSHPKHAAAPHPPMHRVRVPGAGHSVPRFDAKTLITKCNCMASDYWRNASIANPGSREWRVLMQLLLNYTSPPSVLKKLGYGHVLNGAWWSSLTGRIVRDAYRARLPIAYRVDTLKYSTVIAVAVPGKPPLFAVISFPNMTAIVRDLFPRVATWLIIGVPEALDRPKPRIELVHEYAGIAADRGYTFRVEYVLWRNNLNHPNIYLLDYSLLRGPMTPWGRALVSVFLVQPVFWEKFDIQRYMELAWWLTNAYPALSLANNILATKGTPPYVVYVYAAYEARSFINAVYVKLKETTFTPFELVAYGGVCNGFAEATNVVANLGLGLAVSYIGTTFSPEGHAVSTALLPTTLVPPGWQKKDDPNFIDIDMDGKIDGDIETSDTAEVSYKPIYDNFVIETAYPPFSYTLFTGRIAGELLDIYGSKPRPVTVKDLCLFRYPNESIKSRKPCPNTTPEPYYGWYLSGLAEYPYTLPKYMQEPYTPKLRRLTTYWANKARQWLNTTDAKKLMCIGNPKALEKLFNLLTSLLNTTKKDWRTEEQILSLFLKAELLPCKYPPSPKTITKQQPLKNAQKIQQLFRQLLPRVTKTTPQPQNIQETLHTLLGSLQLS